MIVRPMRSYGADSLTKRSPEWLTKMPAVNHSANAARPSGWISPGDHHA